MNTLLIFYPFFIIILIIFFFFLSFKIGLVDKPSSRKIHEGNIPLIGGITGCLSIFIFTNIVIDDNILLSIILISSLIFLVGILDDIFDIHFSYRLVLQFVIILIAIGYGFSIKELGYYNLTGKLNLGLFGINKKL